MNYWSLVQSLSSLIECLNRLKRHPEQFSHGERTPEYYKKFFTDEIDELSQEHLTEDKPKFSWTASLDFEASTDQRLVFNVVSQKENEMSYNHVAIVTPLFEDIHVEILGGPERNRIILQNYLNVHLGLAVEDTRRN